MFAGIGSKDNVVVKSPFMLPDLPDLPSNSPRKSPHKNSSITSASVTSAKVTSADVTPTSAVDSESSGEISHEPIGNYSSMRAASNAEKTSPDRTSPDITSPVDGCRSPKPDENALDSSLAVSESEASSSGKESATSADGVDYASDKNRFSCKNYRIVCHCGASNCRKFLF